MWKKDKHGAPSVCQFINGTDSTAAAPFRQEGDNFYIYASDICRSVQLFYKEKVTYKGIAGFRYVTKDNFLNDIGPNYGNECFCVDKIAGALKHEDGCLYSGAIDLSECLGLRYFQKISMSGLILFQNYYRRTDSRNDAALL
jgi:lysosome membrane protein 2